MARKLDEVMSELPKERQARVQARTMELATLKDLRKAAQQTQAQMAASLGVRQETISRLEQRSDMLLTPSEAAICAWVCWAALRKSLSVANSMVRACTRACLSLGSSDITSSSFLAMWGLHGGYVQIIQVIVIALALISRRS